MKDTLNNLLLLTVGDCMKLVAPLGLSYQSMRKDGCLNIICVVVALVSTICTSFGDLVRGYCY